MAIGKHSDFVLHDDQFHGGMIDKIQQNLNGFDAASNGAIILDSQQLIGNYSRESFNNLITGLISRRDLTSTSAQTPTAMTRDEKIAVKIFRKVKEIQQTMGSWRTIGKDPQEMSFILGQMVADAMLQDKLNTTLAALEGALRNQSSNLLNVAAQGSGQYVSHKNLNKALRLMGDASASIVMWAMDGESYHDLVGQSITDNIFQVAGQTIVSGVPATFNRPVLITDAPALEDTVGSGSAAYTTKTIMGLRAGAATVTDSESVDTLFEPVGGGEQLTYRFQAEYAFNLGLAGFKWDTTNGGANPTDATLATGTNWDKVVASHKSLAGVALVVKEGNA